MAGPNSEGFASYPRGEQGLSYDHLKNLSDGYRGLSWAFLVNVLTVLGENLVTRLSGGEEAPAALFFGAMILVAGIVFFMTLGPNRKLGAALGWSPGGPILASILVALNSALCCGVIG